MSWALLAALLGALVVGVFASLVRRAELGRMRGALSARDEARASGAAEARLQHPVVDLSRCLGCGTCVAACPEDGVLELIHGQAVVVRGARCKGISACERECPAGAISVELTNLATRTDVPVLVDSFEAYGTRGLFLAGEVTAHALIKTAVEHGKAVAAEVARRTPGAAGTLDEALDLCIVGAGPAGLACALEAQSRGLRFLVLEQEREPGGTVAKYPRGKLILNEPVDLPLHGRLGRNAYTKEQLMRLWRGIVAEHRIPVRGGVVFEGLERDSAGVFTVRSNSAPVLARHVCLAIGRRGTPNRLGVPGEELGKVAYGLMDAQAHRGRRVLVVGGGDSAVEAALGLAEQPGNVVALAYRRDEFSRVRSRSLEGLERAEREGRLTVLRRTEVAEIRADSVELARVNGTGIERFAVPNDEVFVLAGGSAPIELLARNGVSFDPALRTPGGSPSERGPGVLPALVGGLLVTLVALVWALLHRDYYALPMALRPTHPKHLWLRPGMGAGLALGVAATGLVLVNLLYLVRRSPRIRLEFGSLSAWMTSHVATGVLAFLCALMHAAMAPRDTVGGHALWALLVLLVTGGIGRYFYAWVPRAANGRELELEEVRARFEGAGERRGPFADRARALVHSATEAGRWRGTLVGRAAGVLSMHRGRNRLLARIRTEGRTEGVAEDELAEILALAERAHSAALGAAHLEDLRALLAGWRWLHRWVAALMVLLATLHVVHALLYSAFLDGVTP